MIEYTATFQDGHAERRTLQEGLKYPYAFAYRITWNDGTRPSFGFSSSEKQARSAGNSARRQVGSPGTVEVVPVTTRHVDVYGDTK